MAQQHLPLFHVCAIDFDPSEMSSHHIVCAIYFSHVPSVARGSPLFIVYSSVVSSDLFTTLPLFDQIGRLEFGLMWISVMPVMIQKCNTLKHYSVALETRQSVGG